jgi:nicotinamide riboside transporter PnuC
MHLSILLLFFYLKGIIVFLCYFYIYLTENTNSAIDLQIFETRVSISLYWKLGSQYQKNTKEWGIYDKISLKIITKWIFLCYLIGLRLLLLHDDQ